MVGCSAFGCSNSKTKCPEKSFHTFPIKNSEIIDKWKRAVKRQGEDGNLWNPGKENRLCSDHFTDLDYQVRPGASRRLLKPTAIPTVFPTYPLHVQPKSHSRPSPRKRKHSVSCSQSVASPTSVCSPVSASTSQTQDHGYSLPSSYIKAICKSTTDATIGQLRKKVKALQKHTGRQKKKIDKLSDLIVELKDKRLIETEPADIIASFFDNTILDMITNELTNHKRKQGGQRYSETVKQFSLTLFYYSPQAYEYCRTVFTLPHPSSIRGWLSNIKIEPGFLANVLDVVALSQQTEFCLVVDSMSIRKQTTYENGQFTGFCDYDGLIAEDKNSIASEALVFLLVPLKGISKQYPIGYFLVDKVTARVQAELIKTAIVLTAEKNLRICTVTCDGCAANISTLTLLGCKLDPEDCIPYFSHDSLQHKVFATLDICHMLKLARNALADMGAFVTDTNERISWEYIVRLSSIQDDVGLHFANKVTINHIQWQKVKMKVKFAAQVFSTSVADALVFLQQSGVAGFEGCLPTVEFIRQIDRAFDILNSRSKFGKFYKSAIDLSNLADRRKVLQEFSLYLLSLKTVNGLPLYKSRRKTFIVGFVSTCKSILQLSDSLLRQSDHGYGYMLTIRFSQDHLESLFSKIRRMGGHNNNPSAPHFKAALKRLLCKQSIQSSQSANCLDCESTSSVFKLEWSKRRSPLPSSDELDQQDFEELGACNIGEQPLADSILYYISGFIVRTMRGTVSCDCCSDALFDTKPTLTDHMYGYSFSAPHQALTNIKDRGGLVLPSEPVFKVVKRCEHVFRQTVLANPKNYIARKSLLHFLCATYRFSVSEDRPLLTFLHNCASETGVLSHSHQLTNIIIEKYFRLRLKHYCKQYNMKVINKGSASDRNRLSRLVIFKHR